MPGRVWLDTFACPWLALTVCFQPSSLSGILSLRDLSQAHDRQLQESLAQHAQIHSKHTPKSLNLLFSIYSKWLPCLLLINALPGACPLSRLLPSTPSKTASHQSCASIFLFINRPHFASAVETWGDPDESSPAVQRAWIFQGKNSRIRSAPCTAMPLAGLLSAHDFQIDFSTTQLPASPPPLMSLLARPYTAAVYTPYTLPSWTWVPIQTRPCFSVCSVLAFSLS